MSLDSLDEDLLFDNSNQEGTGKVNAVNWLKECNELERKFNVGLLIILFICAICVFIISFTFSGFVVSIVMVLFGLILYIFNSKKFKKLRTLHNHQFLLEGNRIVEIRNTNKRIFRIDQLKDIQLHNWGIEIKDKSKTYEDRIMLIPKLLSNFNEIKSALKIK